MSGEKMHPRQMLNRLGGTAHRKKLVAERVFRELRGGAGEAETPIAALPRLSPDLR